MANETSFPRLRAWLDQSCSRDQPRLWRLVYSPTYNFLFLRIAGKTGGTTVEFSYLVPALCRLLDHRNVTRTEGLFGGARVKQGCVEHLQSQGHLFRHGDSTQRSFAQLKLERTVLFTLVRDPCARAVSSYTYCVDAERGAKNYTFAQYIREPLGMRVFGRTPIRRTDFHFLPQAALFAKHRPCGDIHIVQTERLNAQMQAIVERINAARDHRLPSLPPFPQEAASNHNSLSSATVPSGACSCPGSSPCANALWRSPFREDVELLEYPSCSHAGLRRRRLQAAATGGRALGKARGVHLLYSPVG